MTVPELTGLAVSLFLAVSLGCLWWLTLGGKR